MAPKPQKEEPKSLDVVDASKEIVNLSERFPVTILELEPSDAWRVAIQKEAQFMYVHKAAFQPNREGYDRAEILLKKLEGVEQINLEHWVKLDIAFLSRMAWAKKEHDKIDWDNLPF